MNIKGPGIFPRRACQAHTCFRAMLTRREGSGEWSTQQVGSICSGRVTFVVFSNKRPKLKGIIFYFFHFYNVFVVHFLILLPSSFSESLSKLSCARNNSVLCCWTRVLNLEPYFPLEPTRSCIIFVWFCRSLFCSCLRVIFWIFSNFQWFISQKGEFQGQQCYSACIL